MTGKDMDHLIARRALRTARQDGTYTGIRLARGRNVRAMRREVCVPLRIADLKFERYIITYILRNN